MRGISKMFAVTILALGMGIAVAAPALADPDEVTYLSDLRDEGFSGSDAVLLDLGYEACHDWDNGVSRSKIVEDIFQNTGESVDHDDAMFVFESATLFLC